MTNLDILAAIGDKRETPRRKFMPLIALIVTAALYMAVGAYRWTLERAAFLVVAIFIHECGHLAAMKIFRYKNIKMLFIPFLGGIAAGEPDEHDSAKIALIAISGPLVGLAAALVAMLLAAMSRNATFAEFARLSLLLNAFNLLPVVPLDGGIFLSETLFARFPSAELAFKIVAVVALFFLAMTLKWPGLAVLGLILLLPLKASYQMSKALDRLRLDASMRVGELSEEKVARIRNEIGAANPFIEKMRNEARLPAFVASAWARINKKFPGPLKTSGLLVLYLAVIIVVPLELVGAKRVLGDVSPALAYNSKGLAELSHHDFGMAVADFNRAVALAPSDLKFRLNRGVARFVAGDSSGAYDDFNASILGGSKDPSAYYFRGMAKLEQDDLSGATADFCSAITLKSNDSHFYLGLGEAELRSKDFEDAIKNINRSIELNSKDGHAWISRGEALDMQGDFSGARENYEAAVQLLPQDPVPRFRLALILRRQSVDEAGAGLDAEVPKINDPWLKAIGTYVTVQLTDSALLKATQSPNTRIGHRRQAQACYYIGMRYLLDVNLAAARDYFSKAIAAGSPAIPEYSLAQAELDRLGSN